MIRQDQISTELGHSQSHHREGEVEEVSKTEDFDQDPAVITVTEEGEETRGTRHERTKVVVEIMREHQSAIIARKDIHQADQIAQL